jgi:hypothetical protein
MKPYTVSCKINGIDCSLEIMAEDKGWAISQFCLAFDLGIEFLHLDYTITEGWK